MGCKRKSKKGADKQSLPECYRGIQKLCSEPHHTLSAGVDLKQGVVPVLGHLVTLLVLLLTSSKGGREEGRRGMGGEDRDFCAAGSSSVLRGVGDDEAKDGKLHGSRTQGGEGEGEQPPSCLRQQVSRQTEGFQDHRDCSSCPSANEQERIGACFGKASSDSPV